MTFEQFQSILGDIRRKQGTKSPMIRVDYAGTVIRGRLARSDSDPSARRDASSPYGIIVLENPGLLRKPETILQIADIPVGGIRPLDEG